VEQLLCAELVEIYGCTEVGSVAWRRTADSDRWRILAGLEPHLDGEATYIRAAHLDSPVRLPDMLEFAQDGSFALAGRDGDLVKVGGKRGGTAQADGSSKQEAETAAAAQLLKELA